MIHIICGLIGAGKSSYAKQHFDFFTDCDEEENKHEQILKTCAADDRGEDIAHITCYPTKEELEAFRGRDCEFILIDTPPDICRENIYKRGRGRDMEDIRGTIHKNEVLYLNILTSGIEFERVELFKSSERW